MVLHRSIRFVLLAQTLVLTPLGPATAERNGSSRLDLSTPEKGYRAFEAAIRSSSIEQFRATRYKMQDPRFKDEDFKQPMNLWTLSFQQCGYGRKIVGVVDGATFYKEHYEPNKTPPPGPELAFVRLEPKGGCQEYFRMAREGDAWKSAEN